MFSRALALLGAAYRLKESGSVDANIRKTRHSCGFGRRCGVNIGLNPLILSAISLVSSVNAGAQQDRFYQPPRPNLLTVPCQVFVNSTAIKIPSAGRGTPYPSNIVVSDVPGNITAVTVKLNTLTHTFPDDIDILLVGPGGQNAVIMSDVGKHFPVAEVTLTLDDAAPDSMPNFEVLTTGTYKPTNILVNDIFPPPAPTTSGGSALSVFNGTTPNGTWSLYLVDDAQGHAGSFDGGWELGILTDYCSRPSPTPTPVTIRVPQDQPTIQQAINAASDRDRVLVSPGTYFEHINYNGKAISVESTDGAETTIIDGNNTGGTIVRFETQETPQSVLAGFTIQHGFATFGAAVRLIGASPTIKGNIFLANTEGTGGSGVGIDGNSSSAVVEGNTFLGNTCDSQYGSGVVTFVNSSSPLIVNNVFVKNHCRAINITLPEGNHPVVANNTIVQNSVGIHVDANVLTFAHLYANNILFANRIGLEVPFLSPGNEPTWINNLVFGNTVDYDGIVDQTGLNGNISSDPMFLETASRYDFELRLESPAIDAGTRSVPNLPPTDFLGKPRVIDGDGNGSALPDIGAYEFIP